MDPTAFRLMMTSGVGEAYWITEFTNDLSYISGIEVDNSGNVYVGASSASIGYQVFIAKFNSNGVLQWQRTLETASSPLYDVENLSLAISTGGDVYFTGFGASSRLLIAKYNTDGVFQWQRTLGTSNANEGYAIAVDSSDNAYVAGATDSQGAGGYDGVIAKYNSSGTLQWQRVLGNTQNNFLYGIALDSSANVHVVGDTTLVGGTDEVRTIAKYNTSGTLQWQRSLSSVGSTLDQASSGVAVDSSGNVYVSGKRFASGTSDSFLAKYDSSGTLQWQTGLLKSSLSAVINYKIDVDDSGNVYAVGAIQDGALVAKYNSSGVLQWQRQLVSDVNSNEGKSIAVSSAGIVYVGGYFLYYDPISEQDIPYAFAAKLPTDGSLTGTYGGSGGNVTYAVTSNTVYTPTETSATSTLTSATSTLPANTSTLADAAGTYYTSIIDL
jgi:hypothetical protein